MRLTKPTLFTNIPVTCEEKDLPGMAHTLLAPREKLKPGLPIIPWNKPNVANLMQILCCLFLNHVGGRHLIGLTHNL